MNALTSADWVFIGRQVANHLWQSTLFAAVAAVLAFSLRKNHAPTWHWLWMAASVKFFVPFSFIVAIGGYFGQSLAPRVAAPRIPAVAGQIAQPFALPDSAFAAPSAQAPRRFNPLPGVITAVWFCGFAAIVVNWRREWRRLAKIVRASAPLREGREVEALRRLKWDRPPGLSRLGLVSSTAKLEPGIFGIFRPVLWLPKGIGEYLSDAQLEASWRTSCATPAAATTCWPQFTWRSRHSSGSIRWSGGWEQGWRKSASAPATKRSSSWEASGEPMPKAF